MNEAALNSSSQRKTSASDEERGFAGTDSALRASSVHSTAASATSGPHMSNDPGMGDESPSSAHTASGPVSTAPSSLTAGKPKVTKSETAGKKPREAKEPKENWLHKAESSSASAATSSAAANAKQAKLVLKGHAGEVLGCDWNPHKEEMLATCSADSTVRIWSLQDDMSKASSAALHHGAKVKPGMRAPTQVTKLTWNAGGNYLASASLDGTLRLWHAGYMVPKTALHAKHIAHEGPIFALKWAPTIVARSPVESATSQPNARDMVATAGTDGLLKLWSITMPPNTPSTAILPPGSLSSPIDSLSLHKASILDMDFTSTRLTATAGQDGSVAVTNLLWRYAPSSGANEASDGALVHAGIEPTILSGQCHAQAVNCVRWRVVSQKSLLASASDDHTIRLWADCEQLMQKAHDNGQQQQELPQATYTLQGHEKGVFIVRWNPVLASANQLASASFDGCVKLWDAETATCTATHTQHTDSVAALEFSPTGASFATGSLDKSIALWDTRSHTIIKQYQCSGCVLDLAFNPISPHKLSANLSDNSAIVFDLRM